MAKEAIFLGDSLKVIRNFPDDPRGQIGHEIDILQNGGTPPSAKPMKTVGKGVWELTDQDADGQYRAFYFVEHLGDVIILHAFQKKDQETPESEKAIARSRYKARVNKG